MLLLTETGGGFLIKISLFKIHCFVIIKKGENVILDFDDHKTFL